MHLPIFLAAALAVSAASAAGPATVQAASTEDRGPIRIIPSSVRLSGPHARQQALVYHARGAGFGAEASGATLRIEDPTIASIDTEGNVRPLRDGTTRLLASFNGQDTGVEVRVQDAAKPQAWSFDRHVQPILSKNSCNTGGCHGALAGKGGFRLSLSAYDPDNDFYNLVRDAGGRRIEPADPLMSLLLTKPTMAVPHKGGRRLQPGGDDYRILAEWIAGGNPGPEPARAALDHIEVEPASIEASKGAKLRLLITAHYADGTREDVTRWAKLSSTDETVAKVDDASGRIEVIGHGAGALNAWFSSRIVTARVTVPFPRPAQPAAVAANAASTAAPTAPANLVDKAVLAQLQRLQLDPSPLCDDATFLRRAHLDAIGIPPTADETRAFLSDHSSTKRTALIDKLLQRPEFTDLWTYRLADIFLINGSSLRPEAVQSYYQWLRDRVESNTPWDVLVREVITARGESLRQGETNFYAVHQDPETMAENVSQAFLGLSINCAKCHNHPLEKWTNDQYYAFANLFARVRAKGWGGDFRSGDGSRTLFVTNEGDLLQPRTGRPQPPAPLDGAPIDPIDTRDRREVLAQWLTSPKNPYFTRAIVNRTWAAFFGTGIINPVDDLRMSNPASNEPLLQDLCAFLIEKRYDLKSLMRLLLQSDAYQRSSDPVDSNRSDTRHFSHYYPRRHMAEVLNDAIIGVTGIPEIFDTVVMKDGDTKKTEFYPSGTRALQLYDTAVRSYFLKAFGRNQREITCECERSSQPSLVQALHLSNGDTINKRLADPKGLLNQWLERHADNGPLIEQAFLAALSRTPLPRELAAYTAAFNAPGAIRREVAEDMVWALLTSREFLFQH